MLYYDILIAVIVGLLIVIANLISALISRRYDGAMVITETETKKMHTLEWNIDPHTLDQRKKVLLEIKTSNE